MQGDNTAPTGLQNIMGLSELRMPENSGLSSNSDTPSFFPANSVRAQGDSFDPSNFAIGRHQENVLGQDVRIVQREPADMLSNTNSDGFGLNNALGTFTQMMTPG